MRLLVSKDTKIVLMRIVLTIFPHLKIHKTFFSQSDIIRDYIKEKYVPKIEETELDENSLELNALPW